MLGSIELAVVSRIPTIIVVGEVSVPVETAGTENDSV
jgi:hypothetical protein